MNIELYWISGSPYVWRVMLALNAKEVEFTSHRLEAPERKHKEESYLKLNPRGKVPLLLSGGEAIYESLAIIKYVDSLSSICPLFGENALQEAKIWQTIFDFQSYVESNIWLVARYVYQGKVRENILKINKMTERARDEFKILNESLMKTKYCTSDNFSAADCVFYPTLANIVRLNEKDEALKLEDSLGDFRKKYQAIDTYMKNIESMYFFNKTYPPHWRN